jgi:hypothetical protein
MKDYLWLAVEQDLNYCDVCECIIPEGVDGVPSQHIREKHNRDEEDL